MLNTREKAESLIEFSPNLVSSKEKKIRQGMEII